MAQWTPERARAAEALAAHMATLDPRRDWDTHDNKPPGAPDGFKGYWLRVDGKTHHKRRARYSKEGKKRIFKMMRKIKGSHTVEIFSSRRETPIFMSDGLLQLFNIDLICEMEVKQ